MGYKHPMKTMYNDCHFRACCFCVVNIFAGGPPMGIFIVGSHLHFKL